MSGKWSKLLLALTLVSGGCLDPYAPPLSDQEVDILVVDGFLDTSDGTAAVSLSKAVPLSSENTTAPVPMASITLLDDNGASYPFYEPSVGQYRVTGVAIKPEAKYRIHI